jgi:hypothetical protein
MTVTFKVCEKNSSFKTNTQIEKTSLCTVKESLKENYRFALEACSTPDQLVRRWSTQGLYSVVQSSFDCHYPLILDPDAIWLTITKGLATHINLNAEELRKHFVDFDGKVFIEISRDNFVKGGQNPWEDTFPEFSERIGKYIGKKRDLIVSDFSTTTPLAKLASEITLMDAMKSYFDYGMSTRCGIPRVTLEGSVEDWKNIRNRVNVFDELGLSWWTDKLKPVLDEFVSAAQGKDHTDFWKGFYNDGGGSGGPFINGHILAFYPYLTDDKKMDFSSHWITGGNFPKGMSEAPFVWNYYGKMYPMSFNGGVVGVRHEEDASVRAAFAWSVRDSAVPLSNYPLENFTKGMRVHHVDGDVGIVDKAEVTEYVRGDKIESRKLSDVDIVWEQKGKKHHGRWDFPKIFVKEMADGELMPEAESLRKKGSGRQM